MKKTKLILACAGLALVAGLASCGGVDDPDGYTFHDYSSSLASNWNPHAWETNADNSVLGFLSDGFVSLQPKDTKNGVYQWAYDMATSIDDITFEDAGKAALKKYKGMDDDDIAAFEAAMAGDPGEIVYRIKLRDDMKFEDGTPINAQSFVDSAKLLLDPKMKNYRANLYVLGESAVCGAFDYYYQGSQGYFGATGYYDEFKADIYDNLVFCIDSTSIGDYSVFTGSVIQDYAESYNCDNGSAFLSKYLGVTDEELEKIHKCEGKTMTEIAASAELTEGFTLARDCWCTEPNEELHFFVTLAEVAETPFDEVGLYKVDDYTFDYVYNSQLDWSQMMVNMATTWLVHPDMYNNNKDTSGELVTTKYGTSKATSMSYGPYKLQSVEASKQMVLVQNENWYGYSKDAAGKLVSYTNFEVDGQKVRQYQTTKVVIDVLDDAAAKQKFLAGELSNYAPTASELSEYTLSDALYQVEENYVMSFFFNTDVDALKEMDKSKGNKNSVVLSNRTFRAGMSLAIDRAKFVTATPAYTPAFALFNDLNYYDIWNNPESSYRHSAPAMQALCDFYGVEYGEGKPYATLEEAAASITGYNLTQAKSLMKDAHDELVAAGLYSGGEIYVKIGYSKGAIQSDELAQIALINEFLSAAIDGSGFDSITFEAVGNIEDRYGAVPAGEYAIGYGAWGGANFYPYRGMQVYCDPDSYSLNEGACWDPTVETLTIDFDYVDSKGNAQHFGPTTNTWQVWSKNLQSGKYANEDANCKLQILATMEEEYLKKLYRIPLCGTCSAFLLGYQVSYITEKYNVMYDFGGFRLMKYNYTNAEWADYVKKNGGKIDYK